MDEPARKKEIGRRSLLGGAGVVGLGWALSACSGSESGTAPTTVTADTLLPAPGGSALGAGSFALFGSDDMAFQTLFALGGAGQNAEVGEVITVVDQTSQNPGGASYQGLYDSMVAMGDRLADAAADAENKGHRITARAKYLRAAQYFNQALYWVLGTDTPGTEGDAYRAMNAAFTSAARLMEPAWEPMEIPYESGSLSGWLLRPPGASGRRPTIILNNGSDGQHIDMVAMGGLGALERGYNVVLFEGPGQGAQLFLDNVVFRPDWEAVITPLVDVLADRSDVAPDKIALRGVSFGGELCPRAAAFEHRLAALIADPGTPSAWLGYPSVVTDVAKGSNEQEVNDLWASEILPNLSVEEAFNLKKRLEIYTQDAHDEALAGHVPNDWYSISRAIQQFDNSDVVGQITCPTLVTQYEGDSFFGGQGQTLYDSLMVKEKAFVEFTAVDGAQFHCGPMAPQLVGETIYDWLDETLQS